MEDRNYELWECPPLRAWLSREQCAANRRWAGDSPTAKSHVAIDDLHSYALRLRECAACRGVEWWAKRSGKRPRTLSGAQLIANHARDDERRRSMNGVYDGRESAR